MKKGFTILEVLLAAIILGLGLTTILVSMSQAQKMMLGSARLETAQEVMDLGDMAHPLEDVKDPEDGLDVRAEKASELWEAILPDGIRLTRAQEEKFHGYTWEREWLNRHDDKEIERLGGIYVVKVTVKWGDDFRGNHEEESYIALWRKSE